MATHVRVAIVAWSVAACTSSRPHDLLAAIAVDAGRLTKTDVKVATHEFPVDDLELWKGTWAGPSGIDQVLGTSDVVTYGEKAKGKFTEDAILVLKCSARTRKEAVAKGDVILAEEWRYQADKLGKKKVVILATENGAQALVKIQEYLNWNKQKSMWAWTRYVYFRLIDTKAASPEQQAHVAVVEAHKKASARTPEEEEKSRDDILKMHAEAAAQAAQEPLHKGDRVLVTQTGSSEVGMLAKEVEKVGNTTVATVRYKDGEDPVLVPAGQVVKAYAFNGWCRDATKNWYVITGTPFDKDKARKRGDVSLQQCQEGCGKYEDCTAYAFTSVPGNTTYTLCQLYSGGPYTQGENSENVVCYPVQAA